MIVLALALSLSAPKLAAQCAPDDPQDCVQPLLKGEPAPFTGQLLTMRRAAKVAVFQLQLEERVQLELLRHVEPLKIDLEAQKRLTASLEQARKEAQAAYELQLKEAYHWSRSPWFVGTASVVGTSLLFVGAVKAVQTLK